MKVFIPLLFFLSIFVMLPASLMAQTAPEDSDSVIGRWNITVQKNGGEYPSWLEVNRSGFNRLTGYFVGLEGSARPISEIKYSDTRNVYYFAIPPQWKRSGDDLYFEFSPVNGGMSGIQAEDGDTTSWTAVRAPALWRDRPPVWGDPVDLLDETMSQWIIPENSRFRMEAGVLMNKDVGGNLITKETFDDFKLYVEFRYPEGSNSGIYLRGRYEVQIMDNYGEEPASVTIGGVYGFIEPTVNAAKKAGEWQTMDITLLGRYVTIVLNGIEIISNRPIQGITGGALDGNEGEPGPIMLQGDHGAVDFRKIVITPAAD
ncbi:MAG: DUF1080 domain-containing protein [Cyclonatronaceae bacterium]